MIKSKVKTKRLVISIQRSDASKEVGSGVSEKKEVSKMDGMEVSKKCFLAMMNLLLKWH